MIFIEHVPMFRSIILDAAYSLRDRAFVENFWGIILYAVVVCHFWANDIKSNKM